MLFEKVSSFEPSSMIKTSTSKLSSSEAGMRFTTLSMVRSAK
jgi:hypothetical protein